MPVPDVFNFIALDGSAEYGSSSQQARASLLFPGNGVILGPSLACGTFGGQFPPQFKPILDTCLKYQYPLTVFADSFNPDNSTNGSLAFGTPKNDIQGGYKGGEGNFDQPPMDACSGRGRTSGVLVPLDRAGEPAMA